MGFSAAMADWRMPGTDEGLQLAPVAAGLGQFRPLDAVA
jgi:hypothetical protein